MAVPENATRASDPLRNVYYHGTVRSRVESIRAHGLLPRDECQTRDIPVNFVFSKPGAVYVANSPVTAYEWAQIAQTHTANKYDEPVVLAVEVDPAHLYIDRHFGSWECSFYEYHGRVTPDCVLRVLRYNVDF